MSSAAVNGGVLERHGLVVGERSSDWSRWGVVRAIIPGSVLAGLRQLQRQDVSGLGAASTSSVMSKLPSPRGTAVSSDPRRGQARYLRASVVGCTGGGSPPLANGPGLGATGVPAAGSGRTGDGRAVPQHQRDRRQYRSSGQSACGHPPHPPPKTDPATFLWWPDRTSAYDTPEFMGSGKYSQFPVNPRGGKMRKQSVSGQSQQLRAVESQNNVIENSGPHNRRVISAGCSR